MGKASWKKAISQRRSGAWGLVHGSRMTCAPLVGRQRGPSDSNARTFIDRRTASYQRNCLGKRSAITAQTLRV